MRLQCFYSAVVANRKLRKWEPVCTKDTSLLVRQRTVCVLPYDTLLESFYCAYLSVSLFTTAADCLVASADLTAAGDCGFLFLVFNYPSCLSSFAHS